MKRNIIALSIALSIISILISGCSKNPNALNLSGTVKNETSGKVYLQRYENKSFFTIDSAEVKNGQFQFRSEVKLPEIYGLSLKSSTENPFDSFIIFLDNNEITVELDTTAGFENTVVKGSKEHDLFLELSSQRKLPIKDIIKAHPSSIAALYIFYRYYSYRLSPEEIKEAIDLLDPSLKETDYVKVLNELANTLSKVSIGQKAPDFAANTINGTNVHLYDVLGKGYVLIDFWASWCAPCRKENPNLIKLYEKYKAKNFEIVGVSLDNKTEPWINAIEKDGLQWAQWIDKNAWAGEGVKNYGVRLIPSNFLIDKEGVIVAKNLKGEDLEHFLSDLLD